jgi:hypothetical protein
MPIPAWSQNTAEKAPPPPKSESAKETPPAPKESEEKPVEKSGEKQPAESGSGNVNAAEGGSQSKPDAEKEKPAADPQQDDRLPDPPVEPEPAGDKTAPVNDPNNPAPEQGTDPEEVRQVTNVAEVDPRNPQPDPPDESSGPQQTPGPGGTGDAAANAAESSENTPAEDLAAAVANVAEGTQPFDGNTVAEPPETMMILPAPEDVAGNVAEYTPPTISLDIPMLDEIGPPPDVDEFISPERSYLGRRPLPALDETETDQERTARNVEESLRLLDLAGETRPEGGLNIPLTNGQLTFKAADAFQYDRPNRKLTFTGNAELLFGNIAVWADFIEVNDQAATAYARGYVAVQQGNDIIFADEAYLNYDTETFEMFYVEGNTTGPRVKGNIFFMADRALGTFDQMVLYNADVTTCDPYCGQLKEYRLNARKVNYRKQQSVVLHDVWVYVHNNKTVYVPILAIPIMHEQKQYQPEESEIEQSYGWSRAEGAFSKFAYTYSSRYTEKTNKPLRGVFKMDVMQRRGVGVGLRQDFYTSALGVTTISTYFKEEWPQFVAVDLFGRAEARSDSGNEFSFTLDQELNLSRDLRGSLKVDRQKSFVPSQSGSSTGSLVNNWRNNLRLDYTHGHTRANMGLRHNLDIRGGNTTGTGDDITQVPRSEPVSISADLGVSQKLSEELELSANGNFISNKSQNQTRIAADQEAGYDVNLTFRGKQDTGLDGYTGKVSYKESGIDLDGEDNTTDRNTNVNREIPSIELTAPRDLINDGAYFTTFKLNIDKLVTGRRRDAQAAQRLKLEVGGGDRYDFSGFSSMNTSANFKQYWYDDTNSQYVVNTNVTYKYDPKSWYQFDAAWRLNYQQGVQEPPVRGDRSTKQQSLTYNWTFGNMRSWRWQLRSGYNLETGRPNPVSSTFTFDPNRTFGLTHTLTLNNRIGPNKDAGNDTTHSSWVFNQSHLVGTWRSPYIADDGYYNWLLNFSIDNDPERAWELTKLSTSWFKRHGHGWSTELVGDYRLTANGPTPDFSVPFLRDYLKKVTVRKVNCCTTMEMGYRTEIKEVYLNMYINALQQYPLHADYRAENGNPFAGTDTFFPWENVRQDVLNDVFGINQRLPFF